MKNFLLLILAFVIVYILWNLVIGLIAHLVAGIIGILFTIGMILLFSYLVYAVFKALTRQKI